MLWRLTAVCLLATSAFGVSPVREEFGRTRDGTPVAAFVLTNDHGLTVRLIEFGASVQSLVVPDAAGAEADVVLGFDDLAAYETGGPPFGRTIGRYANRIAGASFELDGETFSLEANAGPHHIHGGRDAAFANRVWEGRPVNVEGASAVEFELTSPNGDGGYPGRLKTTVRYVVPDDENVLRIEYAANADRPTVLNLTNHSYFNLGGHNGLPVTDHRFEIAADSYTLTDESRIPTGEVAAVEGTAFDLRRPTGLSEALAVLGASEQPIFDVNYAFGPQPDGSTTPRRVARVVEPDGGRTMTVRTTEPGLQFYTGDFGRPIAGKGGAEYVGRASFCLETQHYPDSPNRPEFPSTVLRPGETYRSVTEYAFDVVTK